MMNSIYFHTSDYCMKSLGQGKFSVVISVFLIFSSYSSKTDMVLNKCFHFDRFSVSQFYDLQATYCISVLCIPF